MRFLHTSTSGLIAEYLCVKVADLPTLTGAELALVENAGLFCLTMNGQDSDSNVIFACAKAAQSAKALFGAKHIAFLGLFDGLICQKPTHPVVKFLGNLFRRDGPGRFELVSSKHGQTCKMLVPPAATIIKPLEPQPGTVLTIAARDFLGLESKYWSQLSDIKL